MDVLDLREFYLGPLGAATRRIIAERLAGRWPGLKGARLLGLGYAAPYLGALAEGTERTLCFMPGRLGAMRWPEEGPTATAMVDEAALPLADNSVDFALIIHGLEITEDLPGMLQELFRVLTPQGRALFVVPNRRGLWARFDSTPFGQGRPFSRGQMAHLLREAEFSPLGWSQCLFMPPIRRKAVIRSAMMFERLGLSFSIGFSGLLMVEAVKQVYALPKGKKVRRLVPRLKPALSPAPALRG